MRHIAAAAAMSMCAASALAHCLSIHTASNTNNFRIKYASAHVTAPSVKLTFKAANAAVYRPQVGCCSAKSGTFASESKEFSRTSMKNC